MASWEGSADILGAAPGSRVRKEISETLPEQDAATISHNIRSLFAATDGASQTAPSARKRRKIDDSVRVDLHSERFNEAESVVLAQVVLQLNLPSSSVAPSGSDSCSKMPESCNPLILSFESFRRTQPDNFQVGLHNLNAGGGVTLDANAPSEFLDRVSPHLNVAMRLAISSEGTPRKPHSRAAFCRCLLISSAQSPDTYTLQVEIRWKLGMSVVEDPKVQNNLMKEDLHFLARYLPDAASQSEQQWTLSDFYDSVYVPPVDLQISPRIAESLSGTTLYPFQQRTVHWLLQREGAELSSSGVTAPLAESAPPASFQQATDAVGRTCYVSRLRGMVVADLEAAKGDSLQSLRGGILAEEMGLGKTVELVALMTHHKRSPSKDPIFDAYTGTQVQPSGATLIITPPTILEQWISELSTHAPELKVLHYKGLPSASAPQREHAVATTETLLQYDVVVTTYNVLSKEIHHAKPPPDRSFRNAKRYERRNSPLMEISWWRVCLDEAQMIESGVSQAATVARIIPRCNAWAVSGTPLRKDVQDLRGLLVFLRCDAFASNGTVWNRLDKSSFRAIFGQIALRHTKDKIRQELRLPPQKRVVLTVPFTTIEEQNYSDMIRQMCDACFMTPEGIPIDESHDTSDPEVIERMREWLVRLRQTCLHAHVGRKNRKALGARHGVVRTVHEVLEIMIEQRDSKWKTEAREMIICRIKLGHIKAYAGNVENRAQTALEHYEQALVEAQEYVRFCREDLIAEQQKIGNNTATEGVLPSEALDSDADDEKDSESLGRIPVLRKSLRTFLEVEHMCNFFIATSWHQIKENPQFAAPESEEFHRLDRLETDWYQKAKLIRRELLNASKRRALSYMHKVESKKASPISKLTDLPDLGGIESRKILETMDDLGDYLNAQAELIEKWRAKIVEILLLRLIDDDDDQETTGEEYDESLKAQDELYVYIMALRTLVADRNSAVNGLQDMLVEHELKAAEKQALLRDDDVEKNNRGHAPELVIDVAETRRTLQARLRGGSLKGIISGIRSLITGLQWKADGGDSRAAAELGVAQKHLSKIQEMTNQQGKMVTELEKEQELFRATMNQRLEYYRQFQHISDSVAKYKEELDETLDEREFNKYLMLREQHMLMVKKLKSRRAYLINLREENQRDNQADCIICQDTIQVGVLTTCGHQYCKECINQWWLEHRTCPMCKQRLKSSDFKNISFKPGEIKAQEENHELGNTSSQTPTPASSSNTTIYSDISDSALKEIKTIDLDGSYGTKIDMIARHLLWIRANDPGAKSLIFSQFGDFLEVLHSALARWKIGASSIVDKHGIQKFKSDPAMECFLLDAKSDSSGLNLVNATYVFLCEPLINPAIELQAIARVHRIGQQRPTTVFMYLVSDTVEEAIYDISVARRMEHIKSASSSSSGSATPVVLQETSLDQANSAELQAAPLKKLLSKKGNGEAVDNDDLWHCLFGKQKRTGKPVEPVVEREVARHLRGEAAEERRLVVRG